MREDPDPDRADLFRRVGVLEDRIRALVAHRRSDDPAPDDPFRGLYLSEEAVDRLLLPRVPDPAPDTAVVDDVERAADAAEAQGAVLRLRRLARDASLTRLDEHLLLVALLPDLDARFERLIGYLNDDVTRRRASVGLALEILGVPPTSVEARERVGDGAPLVESGLLWVEDGDRPLLTRALRVPDRVTAHLLGGTAPDPVLADVLCRRVAYDAYPAAALADAIGAGHRLVHVRERVAGTGAAMATAALVRAGRPTVGLDLGRLASQPDAGLPVRVAGREALLIGGGIVAGPVEALASAAPAALRRLAALPVPVLLVGAATWDPDWSDVVPLLCEAPVPGPDERIALWHQALGPVGVEGAATATEHFVLSPHQIDRAVRAARAAAALTGGTVTPDHLRRGARSQNAAGLERLARRIEPEVGWDDLVLPPVVLRQLTELAARARHRDRVLTEWRMRPGGGRGRGITALFAGDSGTGKTMSAEVVAGALGLDLYTVDLATVVDKYVGETEKNLERIFSEASGVNAVLLFDEADAIFGKRSEVRDAHDRYANIESAFLLQRMETFDGLAVLATNLRANLDEAFTRRLDAIIDFPTPDVDLRLALWQRCLAAPLPVAGDLDLDYCAQAFELSGGNIRSVAITAAYLAAEAGAPVDMGMVIAAVHEEYRKLGRLVLEREFGPYLAQLR
ncbi:ATP-binding protein [Blastococcus sp. CT_GayMR19]|uniref:ATP-binding protein n=1 Tax=Blastococcus sp. CT_GayMR19 TaxID=2559608 RepID=UPI001ADD8466|nr:ATP-binding protein [Blastococcus sp. CT_GayMR19]